MKTIFRTSQKAAAYFMAVLSMALITFSSCTEEVVDDDYVALVRLDTPTGAMAVTEATTEYELKFSWDQVDEAYSYTAQIRLSEYGDIVSEIITTEKFALFSELEHSTTYYFRVRSVDEFNEAKNSDWSDWVESATLVVDPQYSPLSTPEDLYCDNAATTATSLKFGWQVVENAVSYTYRYSAEGVEEVFADTESLSVELTGLTQGLAYTFSVRANPAADSDEYRSSSYSSAVTASTVAILATPQDLQYTLRMAEAVTFEWSEVDGAASYAFELYESDMTTPVLVSSTMLQSASAASGITVNTTNTTASFIGLSKDTYYSFRVMALATEGDASVEDSNYTDYCVVKTLLTDATQLAAPSLSTAFLNQVSFTVEWSAIASAASYKYQLGESTAEAEAAGSVAIEADADTGIIPTSLSKSSLTPATTYYLRIMSCPSEDDATKSDSEWSEWYQISTPALAAALTVTTADEFDAAFDCIAVGGVITIEAGNYNFNSTFTLDKALTLQGADALNRPVVNLKSFALMPSEVCEAIVIKDIEFTSYSLDDDDNTVEGSYLGSYFIDNSGQGAMVNNLTIDNCLVYGGFKSAFLRINRVAYGVENLTITNNVVSVGGNDGNIIGANGQEFAASTWVIKNNTFDNLGAAYDGSKTAQLVRLPTSTSASFTLDMSNNTLYNMVTLSGKKIIEAGSTCAVTFTKNIVTIPEANAWASGLGADVITECSDNFVYYSTIDIDGFTNADPQITSYEFLKNYTPTNADAVAAGAGDPRWLE